MLTRPSDTTRRILLEAAFEEIRIFGFQAASLSHILDKVDVTKGALYHHFPDKKALGYAVVEEIIKEMVIQEWVVPLAVGNPIDALLQTLQQEGCKLAEDKQFIGCPLSNLSQELSGIDEGFRHRIQQIYALWRQSISDAFQRGQIAHYVRTEIDTDAAAIFIIAAIEGCLNMAKNSNDARLLYQCGAGLAHYLGTLRFKPNP
jgi:AcrR family transcriptional regulator